MDVTKIDRENLVVECLNNKVDFSSHVRGVDDEVVKLEAARGELGDEGDSEADLGQVRKTYRLLVHFLSVQGDVQVNFHGRGDVGGVEANSVVELDNLHKDDAQTTIK